MTLLPPSVYIYIYYIMYIIYIIIYIIYYIYMYKHTNAVVRDVEPNDWVWQDFGCSCCRFFLPFRTLDVTLDLKDPHYPNHDLGSLELAVTLIPKEGDFREAVSFYFWLCLFFKLMCLNWTVNMKWDVMPIVVSYKYIKTQWTAQFIYFFSKYNHVLQL